MYLMHVKGFQIHFCSELLITREEMKTRIEELIITYDLHTPLGCCAWACTVHSVSQQSGASILIWKMKSNYHRGLGLL